MRFTTQEMFTVNATEDTPPPTHFGTSDPTPYPCDLAAWASTVLPRAGHAS